MPNTPVLTHTPAICPHLVIANVRQAGAAELALDSNAAALGLDDTVLQHVVLRGCIPEALVVPQAVLLVGTSRRAGIETVPQHRVGIGALERKSAHTRGCLQACLLGQRLHDRCGCLSQDVGRQLASWLELSQRADHVRVDCCERCDGVADLGCQLRCCMHQTNAAGCRLGMAKLRLGRTEAQRQAATPQHCRGGAHFNGVAPGGTCST